MLWNLPHTMVPFVFGLMVFLMVPLTTWLSLCSEELHGVLMVLLLQAYSPVFDVEKVKAGLEAWTPMCRLCSWANVPGKVIEY